MRAYLAMFVAAWLIGIVSGVVFPGSFWVAILLGVVVMVVSRRLELGWSISIAAASLVCLGGILGMQATAVAAGAPPCGDSPAPFAVEVRNLERLEANRVQYLVQDEEHCHLLLTASRWPVYQIGDRLRVTGEVQSVADIPEEYAGYAQHLQRRGIGATIRYPTLERLTLGKAPRLVAIQTALAKKLEATLPEPEAGVAVEMVLGRRGSVSQELLDTFRVTGVGHILAISGLNISLLVALFVAVTKLLPLPGEARTLLTLGLLWLYIGIIAAPISAQRAALFWTVALLALRLQLLTSLPSAILLAASGLLTFQPLMIRDIGFQLSFAAVIGIGGMLLLFRPYLPVRAPFRFLVGVAAVSLGATLITWPLVAFHFGIVSLINLPANIILVPAASIFMVIVVLELLASFIFSPLALLLGWAAHVVWQSFAVVNGWLAKVPGGALEEVNIPPWLIVVYYCLLAAAAGLFMRRHKRSWREVWAP